MYTKKTLLASAMLSATIILTGCETVPVDGGSDTVSADQHQRALSNQQSEYEKKIRRLEMANSNNQGGSTLAMASSDDLFPPNAKPGHCYSRVLTPAQYRTNSERVMVKPESETISVVPAEYENATERLLVKEASTELVVIPATYKTVEERVMVKPAHTRLKTVPATYTTVSEQVLEKAAHTTWKRGAGFKSSSLDTRIDNGTGEVMCLVEVPATYRTVTKTVLSSPARTVEETIDPIYETVTRRVVDTPATTREVVIPAVYKEVPVTRLVKAEKEVRNTIPATFNTVTSREKITEESLAWSEVLCEDNMTTATVQELQELLQKAGNYDGPIDGSYGPMTERAANNYAKSNGLPTGTRLISLETAKHIGLKI